MRRLLLGILVGAALAAAVKAARARWMPARRDDQLDSLTKEQLYERAQAEGIAGRSEMTKAGLIAALRARRRGAGA
jgi:hypothetical protein